jgi:uncharacterized membrane protein (DUF4010 family)
MNEVLVWTPGLRFVVALAIGFLTGLEREHIRREHSRFFFGGVRTFPLVSLFGFGSAWLFQAGVTFALPMGLLALSVLVGISYLEKIKTGRYGATSEVAALVTFVAGAMAMMADIRLPVALAVVNTLVLSEKSTLEQYVERLDRVELLATLKFLLVAVVIYPALPNAEYTAFRLNPARIWQIVVLVSTIGFAGYMMARKMGPRIGLPLSGLMGGIASSTAVSVASGRLAAANPALFGAALRASLLGSSMMYVRVVVLLAVFARPFLGGLDGRLLLLAAVGMAVAMTVRVQKEEATGPSEVPARQNPVEIRVALLFAFVFVVLRLATQAAQDQFGVAGILGLAGFAGLVDVDPYVLSVAQNGTSVGVAKVGILVAVMVNTIAKGGYFAVLAGARRWAAVWRYGLWALLHIPLMLW